MKWPITNPLGYCYNPICKSNRDCPSALACHPKFKICLQNFCTQNQDCGPLYRCEGGSCVFIECINDYECGYRVRLTNTLKVCFAKIHIYL